MVISPFAPKHIAFPVQTACTCWPKAVHLISIRWLMLPLFLHTHLQGPLSPGSIICLVNKPLPASPHGAPLILYESVILKWHMARQDLAGQYRRSRAAAEEAAVGSDESAGCWPSLVIYLIIFSAGLHPLWIRGRGRRPDNTRSAPRCQAAAAGRKLSWHSWDKWSQLPVNSKAPVSEGGSGSVLHTACRSQVQGLVVKGEADCQEPESILFSWQPTEDHQQPQTLPGLHWMLLTYH